MLTELLVFLKAPTINNNRCSTKQNLKRFIFSIGVYLLIGLFVGGLLVLYNKLLLHIFNINFTAIRDLNYNKITGKSHALLVLYMGFLGPFLEELLFRSWLTFKKGFVTLTFALLAWIFLVKIAGEGFYTQALGLQFFIRMFVSFWLGFTIYHFINGKKIKIFGTKHMSFLVYFSSFIFGLIHLINFQPFRSPIFIFICLPFILPQLLLGLMLAYNRIRGSLIWSISLHIFINFLSIFAYLHRY